MFNITRKENRGQNTDCANISNSCVLTPIFVDPASALNQVLETSSAGIGLFAVYDSTVVPVPPAVWLFGSGLLGLTGVARQKTRS